MGFKGRIPLLPHWTNKETNTVPLTFRGIKIGEAQVDENGKIDAKIIEETPDQLKRLCYEMVNSFSIKRN